MTDTLTHDRGFDVEVTNRSLGYNGPQKMGRRLWAPMWILALVSFAVGFILAVLRAGEISSGATEETIARLGHLVPGFMFLGFAAVFAAVSFAIARILGAFRRGGGEVQEAAGAPVETLKMPLTAKVFMGFMMMGMMAIVIPVIIHFAVAAGIDASSDFEAVEQTALWLEGVRRLGVAMYLFGITFGLATIIHVLRFQSIRIREIAAG